MVVRRAKKCTKYRSHTTHGGGHRKKRRGAGSRGGRGNAGSGKRAGHKKVLGTHSIGAHGFRARRTNIPSKAINVGVLSHSVDSLLQQNKAEKQGEAIVVDLGKLGYTRLLGAGSVSQSLTITISHVTPKAKAKIEAAGGSIK